VISELKRNKKARITVAVICITLATASLVVLSQMNQVAEAAILTPIDEPEGKWTVLSGIWTIENEEYIQSNMAESQSHAGDTAWVNYTIEARMKTVSDSPDLSIMFRLSDSNNFYLLQLIRGNRIRLYKRADGIWTELMVADFGVAMDVWYTLRAIIQDEGTGVRIKGYVDGTEYINYLENPRTFDNGKIGLRTYNTQAHFDDVRVNDLSDNELFFDDFHRTLLVSYAVNVRAETTQIVTTCSWSGSGNITIANLTSPTTTAYNESDMSIYEKTTVSIEGTTSIFNVKRTLLLIAAPTSSETWTLYLNLNGVTTYQVSVEIS